MKVSRRTLLIAGGIVGGGLLLGAVTATGVGVWLGTHDRRASQRSADAVSGGKLVTEWILIEPDGRVRVLSPHTEMGQGTQTSLLQIVLDELDADPERTTIELAPALPAFAHSDFIDGMVGELAEPPEWARGFIQSAAGRVAELANLQFTGGSMAIRFTGWLGFRRAAASGREMLARAGADLMGVPVDQVTTRNGAVHHEASGRSLHYGELAEAAALLPLPAEPTYKKREDYRFIGTAFARPDLPDKVFGKPVYGIDVQVPGMRYATLVPPPMALGRVTGVANQAELEGMRGVEAVVVMDDCVAIVADRIWRAEAAARRAKVTAEPPEGPKRDDAVLAALRWERLEAGDLTSVASKGDATPPTGDGTLERRYSVPFLAHTPMEPLNATVWEEDGRIHVATGTQGPLATRAVAAEALGLSLEDVVFHAHTMGGGFGRRNALFPDGVRWVAQACRVQKAVGGAVKTILSREAEIRLSNYRPADAALAKARLGADGRPTHWEMRVWAGIMNPDEITPHYDIPNVTITTAAADPALPFAFWRSVGASQSQFFIECFIDELASEAGQDPVAYRRALLTDPRAVRLLDKVADMSGWKARPRSKTRAYGVAVTPGFGSWAAQIADVSLVNGRPRVNRVWAAIDCGTAVNTGSVEAQVQGGIHYGLSAALYGKLTLKDGAILESNFHDYRAVGFWDAPRIDVAILDSPDAAVGGVGELSTPGIAPAVVNALAAMQDRIRDLPVVS